MTKKRERITIIHDILKAVQNSGGRSRPTKILYKSNLSTQMLKDYLTELLDKRFLEEIEDKKGHKTYILTEKGHKYLSDFEVIHSFIESYDLDD